jgi:hypothetical protein
MADKHPKRPRDLNQWAKRMTDIVSGEVENREPTCHIQTGPLPDFPPQATRERPQHFPAEYLQF